MFSVVSHPMHLLPIFICTCFLLLNHGLRYSIQNNLIRVVSLFMALAPINQLRNEIEAFGSKLAESEFGVTIKELTMTVKPLLLACRTYMQVILEQALHRHYNLNNLLSTVAGWFRFVTWITSVLENMIFNVFGRSATQIVLGWLLTFVLLVCISFIAWFIRLVIRVCRNLFATSTPVTNERALRLAIPRSAGVNSPVSPRTRLPPFCDAVDTPVTSSMMNVELEYLSDRIDRIERRLS